MRSTLQPRLYFFLLAILSVSSHISCGSISHIRQGEIAFNKGDYHKAHMEYKVALKKEEPLPDFMTKEQLSTRVKKSQKLAAGTLITKAKRSKINKDYKGYKEAIDALKHNYEEHKAAKSYFKAQKKYHTQGKLYLTLAEAYNLTKETKKKLFTYAWYKSNIDDFSNRYKQLMSRYHNVHIRKGRKEFFRYKRYTSALKETRLALQYLPENEDALAFLEKIKLRKKALKSKKKVARLLRKRKYKSAVAHLTIINESFPNDVRIQKKLAYAKRKRALFLVHRGQKVCQDAYWWKCRKYIQEYRDLRIDSEQGKILLSFENDANTEIGRELADRSLAALRKKDPAMALLWSRVAKSLGVPISTLMGAEEQQMMEDLEASVKYKVKLFPPKVGKKKVPVTNASKIIWQNLYTKLQADPEFQKSVTVVPYNVPAENVDGVLSGEFLKFKITRKTKKEMRKGKYIHHQRKYPNPKYEKIKQDLADRNKARANYEKTVAKNERTFEDARIDMHASEKKLELDQTSYENEKKECDFVPTALPPRVQPNTAKIEKKIDALISSDEDNKVDQAIRDWRAENRATQKPIPAPETCDLKIFEKQIALSQDDLNKAQKKFQYRQEVLEQSKNRFQEISTRFFDAELKLAETPKILSEDIKKTLKYSVNIHNVKGYLNVKFKLKDFLTGKIFLQAKAKSRHNEKDYSSDEVGIKPPNYQYQTIENAHEADIGDNVEISQILTKQLVNSLYDEIRFGLAYHGKRFPEAAKRSKGSYAKLRNSVLTLYAEKFLLDPKSDTKKAKEIIQKLLGLSWDNGNIDFNTLNKHRHGKINSISGLVR